MSTAPALLAVAHGSRDPRHEATVASLAARVRHARPGLRVEVAYLDHCGPRVPDALAALAADGVREAVAVPLLLSAAYHAKHDVPAMLDAGRQLRLTVGQAAPLGPHPLLVEAMERRLRAAGVWPGDDAYGVVLASAGSTDPAANAALTDVARAWRRTGWSSVVTAYASALTPAVGDAVRALRDTGAERVAVATYMLAPGLLPDRIAAQAAAAGADVVTAPLGDTPELAALALHRFDEATRLRHPLSA
ncbi:sirohydrochlorin chelatase [Yinghuangia seranimata]|uniref:sirohydrochlorin chelatase n=1 Tax=Yinghuangia seranimata TaxID=408067 RepID=UPI00248C6B4B|nr:sirohydrochlorin chelatase [Yinghuangia seranimata]MDI2125141.1 sirohydrochlorin chelatase [Yinghuangia seranimata]